MRPGVIKNNEKTTPIAVLLRSATGDIIPTHGRTIVTIKLPLHTSKDNDVRVLVAEDVTLPGQSESLVMARLDGHIKEGDIRMIETVNDWEVDQRILVEKALVRVKNIVPVTLKKNTVLEQCTIASSIMSCVNNAGEKPVNECTHNLLNMVSKRCHDLGETELNTVKKPIERLQQYNFDTGHRAGSSHCNADALSKRPCPENCNHCVRLQEKACLLRRTTIIDGHWQPPELQRAQESDAGLKLILNWKNRGERPTWEEGVDGTESRLQLIVPKSRISEVLRDLHDGTSGGHFGIKKMLKKVRERFYWVNCKENVKEWCRKCELCTSVQHDGESRKSGLALQPTEASWIFGFNFNLHFYPTSSQFPKKMAEYQLHLVWQTLLKYLLVFVPFLQNPILSLPLRFPLQSISGGCSSCEDKYHVKCANITGFFDDVKWCCPNCGDKNSPISVAEVRFSELPRKILDATS
ncbi:hypothetical protein CBL_00333 [Carabus blaptoides fortunei]